MGEGARPALCPGGAVEGAGPPRVPQGVPESQAVGLLEDCLPSAGAVLAKRPARGPASAPSRPPQDKPGLLAQPATLPGGHSATQPATSSSRDLEPGGAAPPGPNSRTELSCLRTAKGCEGPSPLPSKSRIPRWRQQSPKLSTSPAQLHGPHPVSDDTPSPGCGLARQGRLHREP